MGETIILISCSDTKETGGKNYYDFQRSILSKTSEKTKLNVYERRIQIYNLIKNGCIEDKLRGGGNRKGGEYFNELRDGPDIILDYFHEDSFKIYMPAYERYKGRFFNWAGGVETFKDAISGECHTLVVSGLYGLIELGEPIQAYNCHLDDELISPNENKKEFRISDLWKNDRLFDNILKDYIKWHNKHYGHDISFIVDLLSEYSYQTIFCWNELSAWFIARGIKRFHREIDSIIEPGFLSDLGLYYKNDIIYGNKECTSPPLKKNINFEYFTLINDIGGTLRFNDSIVPPKYIENQLIDRVTKNIWHELDENTKTELAQAEIAFQRYDRESTKDLNEPAPKLINFFNALENELRVRTKIKAELGPLAKSLYYRKDLIKEDMDRMSICHIISDAASRRNRFGHPDAITRKELLEDRELIIGKNSILNKIVVALQKLS